MSDQINLDMNTKTDDELLEIWANQSEYVSELIEAVRAEIETRGLDSSSVQVRTTEEIEYDRDTALRLREVRRFALSLVVLALVLLLGGLDSGNQSTFLGMLCGILLIVAAIGLWMRRKWALVASIFICGLITLCNSVITAFMWLAWFSGTRPGIIGDALIGTIETAISAGLAFRLNTLRKRSASAETSLGGGLSSPGGVELF